MKSGHIFVMTGVLLSLGLYAAQPKPPSKNRAATGNAASEQIFRPVAFNPPGSVSITTTSLPDGTVGQSYSSAVSATGGYQPYTFSATGLPDGLGIGASGNITGVPTASGTSTVNVTVTDAASGTASQPFSLNILPAAQTLSITTRSLAPGGTGQSYSQQVTAIGGTPPYSFSANGLPAGLSINMSGLITGTPTQNGVYSVAVGVSDAAGAKTTSGFTLTVTSSLTITTTTLAAGAVGQSYFQVISAVGGTSPLTFTATGLPPGLTLTGSSTSDPTAQISGQPTSAGSFVVDVTVMDAKHGGFTSEYTLVVYSAPAISTASPLPDATAGTPYSLALSATGGLGPYKFFLLSGPSTVKISTAGLVTATFSSFGSVTFTAQVIDSLNNSSSKTFTLPVDAALQQLNVSPQSIQVTAPVGGGETPPSQDIMLTGGTSGTSYQLIVDDGNGGAAPPWLQVTPTSGAVPGVIHVSLLPNTLAAGNYSARIRVTAVVGGKTSLPVDVAVSLTETAGTPQLSVFPSTMRFTKHVPMEGLVVHNSGSGGPLNFTATVNGKNSFITNISPSSGQTPAVLSVTANVGAPGAYRDSIHIATSAGSMDIPVSLFVPNPGPVLAVDQTGFRFQVIQGAGTSTTQSIRIMNSGDTGTTVNWSADLISGSDWLSLGSSSGAATTTNPSALVLKTGPGAAAETPGGHYALIRITAPGSQGAPLYVTGVLDVAPSGTAPSPDPTKGGFFFVGAASGAQPATQLLEVGTSSPGPVTVAATTSTSDGAKWLSVSPASATASSTQTGEFSISTNTTGLKPGFYSGKVVVAILNQLRSVNVTLDVAPAGTVISTATGPVSQAVLPRVTQARDASGCVASQIALTETGIVSNFSLPASWPATLEMQLNDDCGGSVVNGTVIASFSNGDPPLTLLGDGVTPFYSATWQPQSSASSVTVTLNAVAPGLTPASAQFTGGVNSNSTPAPSMVIDGLLHNVNPVVGAAVAPGTVSQVYGTNLTTSPDSPSTLPLPVDLQGVQVLVGGLSAPIYYISPTQLTIQVPSELTATSEYQAIIVVGNAYSLPQPVDVVPVAPGVVAFPDGSIVAQHSADFSLVSSTSPAKPGEVLIVYLVGLGATDVVVPSGTPAPSNQLISVSNPVTVTIDGETVQTPFVGLTPGGVGLYQINLVVPADAKTGALPVTITEAGIAANPSTLLVQR